MDVSLNGDIIYNVQFYASVCNPSVGSIVQAKVINTNKFGILAECTILLRNENVPILEIIIAKSSIDENNTVNIENIKPHDLITIEVLGKKYELNDKKISVVGKIMTGNVQHLESEIDNSYQLPVDDAIDDIPDVEDGSTTDGDSSDDVSSDADESDDEKEVGESKEDANVNEEEEEADEDDNEEGFMSENEDDGFFSEGESVLSAENDLNTESYR
jgi:hypothetical protein